MRTLVEVISDMLFVLFVVVPLVVLVLALSDWLWAFECSADVSAVLKPFCQFPL